MPYATTLSRALTAPVLLGWLCACSPAGAGPSVVRTDSAGVEVVTATSEDYALPWRVEPLFTLGGAESGPESFYSVSILNVDADASGRIYVLDTQAHHVAVFDSAGTFLQVLGREGQGPGELSYPGLIDVARDGSVAVLDYGKGGLVRFSPDGEILSEIAPFGSNIRPVYRRHFAQHGSEILEATMLSPTVAGTMRNALQRVAESDTTVLVEVSFPRGEMVRYPSCGGGLNLPRMFEPEISWTVGEEALVVSYSHAYVVDVLVGDQLVRSLRRDLEVRKSTRGLAIADLGEGFTINFGRGPCLIPPEEMVDKRGYSGTLPWIRRLAMTPGGEVWVERKKVGLDVTGPIDVFDPNGAYIGTLPEKTPFPLVFLSESRMGAVEKGELDLERLVVYRIDRSVGGK